MKAKKLLVRERHFYYGKVAVYFAVLFAVTCAFLALLLLVNDGAIGGAEYRTASGDFKGGELVQDYWVFFLLSGISFVVVVMILVFEDKDFSYYSEREVEVVEVKGK